MTAMASHTPSSSPSPRRSAPRDRTDSFLLAGLLLLIGGVLLANQLNWLPVARNAQVWDWLMFGAGALLLVSELVRSVAVEYSRPSTGRLILGAGLLALGLSAIFSIRSELLWPGALLLIGFILLVRNIAGNI